MAAIVTNIRALKNAGILADRNNRSESLDFRRFNLIYGFNGSGKSTLSRIFASLEAGALHPKLPQDCSFEITLDDESDYGVPSKPAGLERRILVFNSDFIDKNLQWSLGKASPVFFIGADQAEAASHLEKTEKRIDELDGQKGLAERALSQTDKVLVAFKRDRAKLTAGRLHLASRKYEAPNLIKDYEQWPADMNFILSDDALKGAEDLRRASEPMPKVDDIEFDTASIPAAFRFISDICGQPLSEVALEEIERFPEMLLWIKQGHEFHQEHDLHNCLLCGNAFSEERRSILASALDDKIDQFVERLNKTAARLTAVLQSLDNLNERAPLSDRFDAGLASDAKEKRASLIDAIAQTKGQLRLLQEALNEKLTKPASPADLSKIPETSAVETTTQALATALKDMNDVIARHNKEVGEFRDRQAQAEELIRKHFLEECREDLSQHIKEHSDAKKTLEDLIKELGEENTKATALRQSIRTHGPAADAINKLVASYLGHRELTVHPVDEGYEIHRHGAVIDGLPSEGEKTAIAIAYFLSTIESDGRKLKDMIVVVDDPVSSLDSKALNFACNLVKSRLSGACQLIVLTHNQQCVNEFRKAWKSRVKPEDGDPPTASLLFINVGVPKEATKRSAAFEPMSKLLREYDSEYHFLFNYVLRFRAANDEHFEHGYMMPNVLRRVMDIFLAFRCPGSSGLAGKIQQLCVAHPELDRDRLVALERLSQVESHSDNLDDLIGFSSMTIEETRDAATALIEMMECVDEKHLKALKKLCA